MIVSDPVGFVGVSRIFVFDLESIAVDSKIASHSVGLKVSVLHSYLNISI